MKRKWLQMFAFVMVIIGACVFVPEAKEAKATTPGVPASSIAWGEIPETQEDDVIFAGWYTDEEYKTPLKSKPAGDALCYAKWVDADILSIKMQASEDKTKLRLVSSVDTLDYLNVGFEIYFTPEGQTERKTTFEASTVLKRINAVNTGVTYAYSPKIISADSEYFVTATMTEIAPKNLDRDFYIRPYWTTCDGTKVYGVSRMFAINDCLSGDKINVTIKDGTDTVLNADETVKVTLGTDTTEVTASVVGKREDYVHLNVDKARTALDSTTKVTYNEESTIYQNLMSKSATDTSWYDADPNADKYVLTTKADLKGIQTKATAASNFANKEIYLVTDVDFRLNPETRGAWTVIDTMAGTFDGQGHTISGIYLNALGMFKTVTGTVCNFKLSDSENIISSHGGGAVIGTLNGTLSNVYADDTVTVSSSFQHAGGLVGKTNISTKTASISNCSFGGTITGTNVSGGNGGILGTADTGNCEIVNCEMTGTVKSGNYAGGLIGFKRNAGTTTIRNCLVTGTVTTSGTSTKAGTIMGSQSSSAGTVYFKNVYTAGTNQVNTTTENTGIIGLGDHGTNMVAYGLTYAVDKKDIKDNAAWSKLNLDFYSEHNEDGAWVAIDGDVPKLKIAVTETDTVLEEDYTGTTNQLGWYYLHTKKTTAGETTDVTPDTGTVFQIETVGDMYGLKDLVNKDTDVFDGDRVELCNDLVFNPNWDGNSENAPEGHNWDGIGTYAFAGTFDGMNHTISKVYQNRAGTHGGLFRRVSGTLQNLTISDSSFNSEYNHIAGAVGHLTGTIDNVHLDAGVTVYGGSNAYNVGGLTAYINSTTSIKNCTFAGTVTGGFSSRGTGGLVGTVQEENAGEVKISNCAFTGTVNGTKPAGGILGMIRTVTGKQLDVKVTDCVVSGTVTLTEESSQRGSVCGRSEANTKIELTRVDTSLCNQTRRCASAEVGTVVDNDNPTQ